MDEAVRYLPTHGKDVTQSHPSKDKIKTLTKDFVRSMEAKDKKSFKKLVTDDFLKVTSWDEKWKSLPSTIAPDLALIKDFFIMDHKGKLYIRFSVLDQNSKKVHYLPESTWYRVTEEEGLWKMDAFLPNFSPDSGP